MVSIRWCWKPRKPKSKHLMEIQAIVNDVHILSWKNSSHLGNFIFFCYCLKVLCWLWNKFWTSKWLYLCSECTEKNISLTFIFIKFDDLITSYRIDSYLWLIWSKQAVVTDFRPVRSWNYFRIFSKWFQISCTLPFSALEVRMSDVETSFYRCRTSQNFESNQAVLEFFLHLVHLYSSFGKRNNDRLLNNAPPAVYNSIGILVSFKAFFMYHDSRVLRHESVKTPFLTMSQIIARLWNLNRVCFAFQFSICGGFKIIGSYWRIFFREIWIWSFFWFDLNNYAPVHVRWFIFFDHWNLTIWKFFKLRNYLGTI